VTSYREAGVDLEAADRHTESIAASVTSTWRERVVGSFGGFAAGVRIPAGYSDPVLMMSTDGVGTKLDLARRAGIWSGVGHDLVAMCVDDLATVGARPLGFVDYMAVGALEPQRDTAIVGSIAAACEEAGCPLLGGETAEHPGVMGAGHVDLAGAVMGVVDAEKALGPERVRVGDLVIGLASPNLRSNGFSLVRAALGDEVERHLPLLLEPSIIYCPAVLEAARGRGVHAAAHITGGGLVTNLRRALPDGLGAEVDTATWARPGVFDLIASYGIAEEEMRRAFNLGIGFCLVVDPALAEEATAAVARHDPRVIGRVEAGEGVVLT